jgi:glycosyltransferase involved in cell wall biosynthesis
MSEPLLSICIPTFKREKIVKQLLESIIIQDADKEMYEVCITDNSETDETKDLVEKYFSHVPNLRYKKVFCKGFLNSVEALHFGKGKYLKLHNDYSIFEEGAISKMIAQIQDAIRSNSYIFFSFGAVKDVQGMDTFSSYDDFMRSISYQATWSSAFGIWKSDLERIDLEGIKPNYMYPHTSYLHRIMNYENYIVDNNYYAKNAELKKKRWLQPC